VAGELVDAGPVELPPGADVVEGIMRPPQRSVPVELPAGEPVALALRYEPAAASGFDTEVAVVTVQLNLARQTSDDRELDEAEALAGAADVAVVVVGTTEEVESEGFDRDSLALPGRQDELVRRVAAANPRTVVVVNAGAPVLLPWVEDVPAVLVTWFGGQEFGNALADVLLGVAEPGGRLPMTWPASEHEAIPSTGPVDGRLVYDESIHVGHRGCERAGIEPAFWLGHGLGYTAWDYLDAQVEVAADGDVVVTVLVRNRGPRPGREVVQVYASRAASAVERPASWLAGFTGVDAGPGQEATAEVRVPARGFAHWDTGSKDWAVEPGTFRLTVGRSSGDPAIAVEVDYRDRGRPLVP
jgi:beta-glucosidase